jgi:indoleamine 2,3-dioxygenase
MRIYMPGAHRRFLSHVESTATLRSFIGDSDNDELLQAYNAAVEELGLFRDIHIQIVTRYIITPSRKNASTGNQGLNLAVASSRLKETGALHGTGGTELLPFLRQSRDETKSTSLN